MKELTIRKENVDFLKLVKMNLKKQDWGKKYILYTYGDVTVDCVMKTMNFPENKATFELMYKCRYGGENYELKACVDYYLSNFSLGEFKKVLIKKIIGMTNESTFSYGNIVRKIAEDICDLQYTYYWNIEYNEIAEAGYGNELEELEGLSSLASEAVNNELQTRVADKKNKVRSKEILSLIIKLNSRLTNVKSLEKELRGEI